MQSIHPYPLPTNLQFQIVCVQTIFHNHFLLFTFPGLIAASTLHFGTVLATFDDALHSYVVCDLVLLPPSPLLSQGPWRKTIKSFPGACTNWKVAPKRFRNRAIPGQIADVNWSWIAFFFLYLDSSSHDDVISWSIYQVPDQGQDSFFIWPVKMMSNQRYERNPLEGPFLRRLMRRPMKLTRWRAVRRKTWVIIF